MSDGWKALTDVDETVGFADWIEPDDGELVTVFDGEVIQGELVDEPAPALPQARRLPSTYSGGPLRGPAPEQLRGVEGEFTLLPNLTGFVPKVPELNPRRRTPNEANPIFDELDNRRGKKSWTKTMHQFRTALTRKQEQHHLEEGAYRDRVHEIEHASEALNALEGGAGR